MHRFTHAGDTRAGQRARSPVQHPPQLQSTTTDFATIKAMADELELRLMRAMQNLKLVFFTTLKSNRLVSLSKETGYIHLDEIEWTSEDLEHGCWSN